MTVLGSGHAAPAIRTSAVQRASGGCVVDMSLLWLGVRAVCEGAHATMVSASIADRIVAQRSVSRAMT
jgi:hypothetical protein